MYDYLAKTFHWPSYRILAGYDSVCLQNPYRVAYDVLEQIEHETQELVKDDDD